MFVVCLANETKSVCRLGVVFAERGKIQCSLQKWLSHGQPLKHRTYTSPSLPTMGFLARILPKPVSRYLRKALDVPNHPRDKSLDYFDSLIILQLSRHDFGGLQLGWSLQHLQNLTRSLFDNCAQVLRCEVHGYAYKDEDYVVHIR